jgi:hypothetical protein
MTVKDESRTESKHSHRNERDASGLVLLRQPIERPAGIVVQ